MYTQDLFKHSEVSPMSDMQYGGVLKSIFSGDFIKFLRIMQPVLIKK